MKTTFWLIWLLISLLGGCADYNTYISMEDESTQSRTVNVINLSDQVVWVALEINNIEISPKDFLEVPLKYSYQLPAPRKEKVTLVIRYFDERGLKVKKFDTVITRQTLQSDQQEYTITNSTLYGSVSEDCVVENITNQTLRISTNQGHRLILGPGDYVVLKDIPSGISIVFWWEAECCPRHTPLRGSFVPDANTPQFYRGKWYGAKVSLTKY